MCRDDARTFPTVSGCDTCIWSACCARPSGPAQDIRAIRSLLRHRTSLVDMATCHVQHMQKALDQMNLQLHHVISDITGTTGLAILDAILDGNRDVDALAALRDPRIRASHETIAKSLVGD